jgi:transcriptional regulator with XRE-family HTH domain
MAEPIVILRTAQEAADYCRRLREAAGISQRQLALALGYTSAQAVANAESPSEESRHGVRMRIIRHLQPGRDVTQAIVVA